MNEKKPTSGDNETNLIFVMSVLDAELREHCLQSCGVRIHVDHVGGDIAAAFLQYVDLLGIRGKNSFRRSVDVDADIGFPTLILDADRREVAGDFSRVS